MFFFSVVEWKLGPGVVFFFVGPNPDASEVGFLRVPFSPGRGS